MTTHAPATPPLSHTPAIPAARAARWFYPACAWLMLGITLYGFQHFFLKGQAFPGRPLTPPIKTLLIVHGVSMLLWVMLFITQPTLVALGKVKTHMLVGRFGAGLALIVLGFGYAVAISAARVNPPDLEIFGLKPPQFIYVPLTAMTVFGLCVALAILNIRRPHLHRALMLIGTLSALSAALGRITWLNDAFADTLWFRVFGAFHSTVLLALILLAARCVVLRRFDQWLAIPVVAMALVYAAMLPISATAAWHNFARMLMG